MNKFQVILNAHNLVEYLMSNLIINKSLLKIYLKGILIVKYYKLFVSIL